MKYLITDPCYIVSNEEWDRLGNLYDWNDNFLRHLLVGEKGETIKVVAETMWGDGSKSFAEGTVGVDAGLVCLAQVPNDYQSDDFLGAITDDYRRAKAIFAEALTI